MEPINRRRDTLLRLVAIPVAATIVSHVVFGRRFPFQPGYHFPLPYFLTVATVMLCCWEVNFRLFHWLDRRIPFYEGTHRRLRWQIGLGGSLTLLTFSLVFPSAIRIYTGQWPAPALILTGTVVCTTLATLINGAYVGRYLVRLLQTPKNAPAPVATETAIPFPAGPARLLIDAGNRTLYLLPDEIAYFYLTNGLVLLLKTDGQQIVTAYDALTRISPQLPESTFFQLNRQIIAHRSAITSLQDDTNRKLQVALRPALHKDHNTEPVTISRYRSADLKKWLASPVTA
ncbi:LytTR family DNA-binding domain-containing protein [Arsenicibacter rosenii]|uniref:HTH LytTR-type domain-containing protein n=1 Tax=Arsenicibacter rosenii TaxID=1750698 RepID=A0A1S2VNV7_9BACT|nr:LytTR family DNA-binding domain-containing protein [Arsenicibacter rosenii]OIN59895.1 hypothetical protein BLX24_08595 [Arsenicibacter rosenii]